MKCWLMRWFHHWVVLHEWGCDFGLCGWLGLCVWKCAVAPVPTMEELVAANIDGLLIELIWYWRVQFLFSWLPPMVLSRVAAVW